MDPNTTVKELRRIAVILHNSKSPSKQLVVKELNKLVYKLAVTTLPGLNAPSTEPKISESAYDVFFNHIEEALWCVETIADSQTIGDNEGGRSLKTRWEDMMYRIGAIRDEADNLIAETHATVGLLV